ncbi:SAM-dependent methyltransferase [Salinisphaera dokdonensis CL-ES53]|uniref:SAM-dependent methyltransferase n=2 Tax=Salinisphaera TaxID=180541 RepID=A0ABV2B1K0_9GAMM
MSNETVMLLLMRLLRQLPLTLRRGAFRALNILVDVDARLARHEREQYRYRDLNITVDLRDQLGRGMIADGFTETPFLRLAERFCTARGGCFLDIGANLGNYSLALAPHFQKTLAFEANPATYELLSQNARANPQLRITPVAIGLSSEAGTLEFYPNDAGNSGASGFEKPRAGSTPVRLEVAPGDAFAGQFEARVGAIKIDVEGHELEVIRGLKTTIARDRPIIFMEWLTTTMQEKGGFEALNALLPGYDLLVPCARTRRHPEGKTNAPRHRLNDLIALAPPYRDKYNLLFCVPRADHPE